MQGCRDGEKIWVDLMAHPEDVHHGEGLGAAQQLQNLLGVIAARPGVIAHQKQHLHASLAAN